MHHQRVENVLKLCDPWIVPLQRKKHAEIHFIFVYIVQDELV
jgi:hypothetical protein